MFDIVNKGQYIVKKEGYIDKIRSHKAILRATNCVVLAVFLFNTVFIDLSWAGRLSRVRPAEDKKNALKVEEFFGTDAIRKEAQARYAAATVTPIANIPTPSTTILPNSEPYDYTLSIIHQPDEPRTTNHERREDRSGEQSPELAEGPAEPQSGEPAEPRASPAFLPFSLPPYLEYYLELNEKISALYSGVDPENFRVIAKALNGHFCFFGWFAHELLANETIRPKREDAVRETKRELEKWGCEVSEACEEAIMKVLEFSNSAETDPRAERFVELTAQMRFYDCWPDIRGAVHSLPANPLPERPYLIIGPGAIFAYCMPRLNPGYKYIAVDRSLFVVKYLDYVKKRLGIENLEIRRADINTVDFPAGSLGVIHSKQALLGPVEVSAEKLLQILNWPARGGNFVIQNDPDIKMRLYTAGRMSTLFQTLIDKGKWIFTYRLGSDNGNWFTSEFDTLTLTVPQRGLGSLFKRPKSSKWKNYVSDIERATGQKVGAPAADRTSPAQNQIAAVRESLITLKRKIENTGTIIRSDDLSRLRQALRNINRNHAKWESALRRTLQVLALGGDEFVLQSFPDPSRNASLRDALELRFISNEAEIEQLGPYLEAMLRVINYVLRKCPKPDQVKPQETIEQPTEPKPLPKPPKKPRTKHVMEHREEQYPATRSLGAHTLDILRQINFNHPGFQQALFTSPKISFDEREKAILEARYFIPLGSPRPDLVDLGKQFKVERERIRQIEAKLLWKVAYFYQYLRHPVDMNSLDREPVYKLWYFSRRAITALETLHVKTIADLCGKTREEFLLLRNFGEESLREIEDALKAHNLGLRESPLAEDRSGEPAEPRASPVDTMIPAPIMPADMMQELRNAVRTAQRPEA